ncbi:hypothetical protein GCM10027404_00250 [Arthrobacter tumbae]
MFPLLEEISSGGFQPFNSHVPGWAYEVFSCKTNPLLFSEFTGSGYDAFDAGVLIAEAAGYP